MKAVVLVAVVIAALLVPHSASAEEVEVSTHSYGGHVRQQLDIYTRGSGAAKKPGLMLIHGGSWKHGDKSLMSTIANDFADRGYVVSAINYRLSQHAIWPAQRADANAALAYVKNNADLWNLDPSRIVVMGVSAGGQIASQLGVYGVGRDRVRGVVALSGVHVPWRAFNAGGLPDATKAEKDLRQAVIELLGCTPKPDGSGCWNRTNGADSTVHVTGDDAPMLLVHSTDEWLEVEHRIRLAKKLREAGADVHVGNSQGTAHGTNIYYQDAEIRDWVIRWIYNHTR